jgi:Flp pilus assembly pilin Flp
MIMNLVRRFVIEETGQGLVEYAFILMLVAIVVIAGLKFLSEGIIGAYDKTTDCLN